MFPLSGQKLVCFRGSHVSTVTSEAWVCLTRAFFGPVKYLGPKRASWSLICGQGQRNTLVLSFMLLSRYTFWKWLQTTLNKHLKTVFFKYCSIGWLFFANNNDAMSYSTRRQLLVYYRQLGLLMGTFLNGFK